MSQLPSLRTDSRQMLSNQSQSSMFSRSRRSTSSLLSLGSDLQSTNSSTRGSRTFKPITYLSERRVSSTTDVIRKYTNIQRNYKLAISALVSEKQSIRLSMDREKAHLDNLIQENEEREVNIRETLDSLKNNRETQKSRGKPPSIEQLRRLADNIMKEGLKFKKQSEDQQRIDKEIQGAENNIHSKFDINQSLNDDISLEKIMEIQRTKLSNLVFQMENSKIKHETTMSNGDMLNRLIFDHNTNKEALKLKMESLTQESKALERTFEEKLQAYAQVLGEMMWKNAAVKSCNEIAKLPKTF